jgi:DNA polymerase I
VRQFRNFTLVDAEEALQRCVEAVEESDMLGIDLETSGFDWWKDEIRVISITTPTGKTFVVDVAKVNVEPLHRALEETHLVAHNAVFDVPFLRRAGCNPERVSCTKVLSRLRWAGRDDVHHTLDDVIKRHAPAHEAKGDLADHEVWKQPEIPEEALAYSANDSKPLLAVYEDEIRVLDHAGMGDVGDLEDRFLRVVIEATDTGMPVDPERWGAVIEEALSRKRELAEQLDDILLEGAPGTEVPEKFTKANAGHEDVAKINWSSPEQKIWAVEALGLEAPTKWDPKKNERRKTLDKNHLHLLDHPIAEALMEYQAIANFPATFKRAIEERFADGWVYPDWQQVQARTGRMSCQNPPMHNMPKRSKLREAIVAPHGDALIALDFSQIEPRVLAVLSKDRALLKAFRDGKDVYRFVASKVTGTPASKVSKTLRSVFKTIVLGLIYGMSEYGLALRVHRDIDPKIPEEKIVAYRDGFFAAFPEASKWREELEAEFHNGSTETRTILGRRRMRVENPRQRWNAPIQGTATDAFKMAAVLLHERAAEVGGFKIVALIHDEVVLLVPAERAAEVESWARDVMAEAAGSVVNKDLPESYHIPIEVDGGSGATLQEAKDAA